ncbi:MAG: hypothetical protein EOR73_10150 [Mesorhizobium sp.]|nr:MAG: hypothetical protein EOR73_10150 [Mesorhizobium sp.]
MQATPYDDRSDLDKLQSQWNKIAGHRSRRDWSAAIVRAATAAEIAANIAVRKRFEVESTFSPEFVNGLLEWPNGIKGKFSRLIVPSEKDKDRKKALGALEAIADQINGKRNAIVHRGAFADEPDAVEVVAGARQVIHGLVQPHHPGFTLLEKPTGATR